MAGKPRKFCKLGHDREGRIGRTCRICNAKWHRDHRKKRTDRQKQSSNERRFKNRIELTDGYVRELMQWKKAPPELVALKRLQLKLARSANLNRRYLNENNERRGRDGQRRT